MSDSEGKEEISVDNLYDMTQDLSKKIDALHEKAFHDKIIQPVLVLTTFLFIFSCYIYMPVGLIVVIVICSSMSLCYPLLIIPMWFAIVLLLFSLTQLL
jgi:hypothetical protein